MASNDERTRLVDLRGMLRNCVLCPQRCGVDRPAGQRGLCGIGPEAVVASAGLHHGEEPCLVGRGGSGTIFFAGCNLACVFCQNWDISQSADGQVATEQDLAETALGLQDRGCANLNFVTPTHVSHAVAAAVVRARAEGLTVPIVYNCGGYESVDTLRRLTGLIEIYMPDFKWADAAAGAAYSGAADYPRIAEAALAEMHRQVGPLRIDADGVAVGGVLVRHLAMPGDIARSEAVIDAVVRAAPGCAINVMGQYRPAHRAGAHEPLRGRVDEGRIIALRDYAAAKGLQLA